MESPQAPILTNVFPQRVSVCVFTRTPPSSSAPACAGMNSERGPLYHQYPGLSKRPELKLDFVVQ